jgi:undecaprenyl-phosphate alpha-N-acetylglucosaminyl 1-phosphatetransferase
MNNMAMWMPFILGAVLAFLFILFLTPLAERVGFLDLPDDRKQHQSSVPMVGGIAIYLVILSASLILDPPEKLSWLLASVTLLVLVGAIDDAIDLKVRVRFFAQLLATLIMIFGSSLWISSIGTDLWGIDTILSWLGIPCTIVVVVGLTNGFNMVDGIDGLASGHMLIGLGTVYLTLSLQHNSIPNIEWLMLLLAAVFAFFLVNLSLTPLKRVFLGDAGSMSLGFILAWILIYYSQQPHQQIHPIAALWCASVPVFDTIAVILRRLKNRSSPFAPDRFHLHHLLCESGLEPKQALVLILTLAVCLNFTGIWITYTISVTLSLYFYLFLMMGYSAFMIFLTADSKIRKK